MQLLKYLQAQGVGSRKQCLWLIENNLIKINDVIQSISKKDINPVEVDKLAIDEQIIEVVPLPFFLYSAQ